MFGVVVTLFGLDLRFAIFPQFFAYQIENVTDISARFVLELRPQLVAMRIYHSLHAFILRPQGLTRRLFL